MTSKKVFIRKSLNLALRKERRVLVTGANGFVGSSVCDYLVSAGFDVVGVVRNKVDISADNRWICQEDLEGNPEILKTFYAVVHLAARVHIFTESSPNPCKEYERVNRDLTLDLAKKCIAAGVEKFVFTSSISIFGRFVKGVIDPMRQPAPDDHYGVSKWEAEQSLVKLFSEQDCSQCIIFRLPMIYGPKNKGNMLHLLKAASLRLPLPLELTIGKRSIAYIRNVCDAVSAVIRDEKKNRPRVQTFFINDGHDLTSGELYEMIFQFYWKKRGLIPMPILWLKCLGDFGSTLENIFSTRIFINKKTIARLLNESRFSSKLFSQEYDWIPPYEPKQGIAETVEWYREQGKTQ
jgi:nucleoside-diphosphate-sugar epimerase